MKKIVFATHNQNKMEEIRSMMPRSIKLLSLDDILCHDEIPETADTIEGNAKLKADHVYYKYNLPCFADDTGLEVEALDGEPGVRSARYAGSDKNSEANIDKLLFNLKDKESRAAQFKTVIHLMDKKENKRFTGICKGYISEKRRGEGGFGYDPIFVPEDHKETFAELSSETKNKIGHRGLAVQKLIDYLESVQ